MLPGFAVPNVPNSAYRDSIFFGKFLLQPVFRSASSNIEPVYYLGDLSICKCGLRMFFALRWVLNSIVFGPIISMTCGNCVSHVIHLGSRIDMRRIATQSVIALMTNNKSIWNFSNKQHVRESVGTKSTPSVPKGSVSFSCFSASPFQTSCI